MSENIKNFLEVETKYDASDIERMSFKMLVSSFNPKTFIYVESRDVYYTKSDTEFLRYRMPATGDASGRSELTFKKKLISTNNNVRVEVNLRTDKNSPETVIAFAEGLGYIKDFSIYKCCDIFIFEDANCVFYSVIDENNDIASFVEIECNEEANMSQEDAWIVVQKYEKMLSPLGISAQKRKRLSLFEMYKK